jgi:hypothetical protein
MAKNLVPARIIKIYTETAVGKSSSVNCSICPPCLVIPPEPEKPQLTPGDNHIIESSALAATAVLNANRCCCCCYARLKFRHARKTAKPKPISAAAAPYAKLEQVR